MDKKMFFGMGLPSQIVVRCGNAPIFTTRGLVELEEQKELNGLDMDVQSVIYLHQRRMPVAC